MLVVPFENASAQQWVSTEGPYSGEVTAVAIGTDGTIAAGTAGKGLFLLRPGESVWTRAVSTAFDGITITSIVSTEDQFVAATSGKGIWRSANGAVGWSGLNIGLDALIIHELTVMSDGRLYAASSSGLYRLSESNTWVQLAGGLENHDIRTATEDSSGTLYAGSFGVGVMMSDDLGLSWQLHGEGLGTSIIRSLLVSHDDELFVGTFGGNVIQRYDASTDTWIASSEGLEAQGVWSVSVDSSGMFYAGGRSEGIFKSEDGRTWTVDDGPRTTISEFAFGDDVGWAASRVGLLRRAIGEEGWKVAGIPFSRVNALHKVGDRLLAGLHLGGVHFSDDQGATWIQSDLNNEAILRFGEGIDGSLYAGTLGSGLFRSIDRGKSWQQLWKTTRVIYSVTTDSSGAILTGTDNGVYRLNVSDSVWTRISPPSVAIRSLLVSRSGSIFAGSEYQGITKSSDNGIEWQQVAPILIDDELWVWDLVELPDGRLAAATTGEGIWWSSDGGDIWKPLPGSGDVAIADLHVTSSGQLMGVGILGQVFLESEDADRVAALGPPFVSSPVRSLSVLDDGSVVVGTEPLGVHRLTEICVGNTICTSSESGNEIPVFAELQVYPSPTTTVATIRATVTRPQEVGWRLIDILGRTVDAGTAPKTVSGTWIGSIDVSRLSAGPYWLLLESTQGHVAKMFVVRR